MIFLALKYIEIGDTTFTKSDLFIMPKTTDDKLIRNLVRQHFIMPVNDSKLLKKVK